MTIEKPQLKKILESAIFAADKPLNLNALSQLFHVDEIPSNEEIVAALEELKEDYADHGVELKQVASGYRFQVRSEFGQWVSRMWEEKPARYSRALLETLALIAYRQPITRGEIEEIRGVSVSSHITKTLQERDWIRVVGHRDVPGRPAMYATTRVFLDYFNLQNLDELPSLAEIRDLDKINEELELVENAGEQPESTQQAEQEEGQEAEAETQAHDDDKNSKLTLRDIAEKMSRLKDSSEDEEEPGSSEIAEPEVDSEADSNDVKAADDQSQQIDSASIDSDSGSVEQEGGSAAETKEEVN